ncbi:MAG: protein-glutamate O-methyltransferase CheR [Sulfitobacter sp.]
MKTTLHNASLDKNSFQAIADLAYRESGLTLVDEKITMIQSRLRHRLRALEISNFTDYCDFVVSENGCDERKQLISALTTNVSHFFRENHHFDALIDHVMTKLPALKRGDRLRIWSAGCSNGQEALSVAIKLYEAIPNISKLNVRILATDIDPEVVHFARAGCYSERLMTGVPLDLRAKYFSQKQSKIGEKTYTAQSNVHSLVQFNELNLLGSWPMRGEFDAIFCRNVVIYFDLKTQTALWPRFRQKLKPDGVFFLGHSERIADPSNFGFRCSKPTTYTTLST